MTCSCKSGYTGKGDVRCDKISRFLISNNYSQELTVLFFLKLHQSNWDVLLTMNALTIRLVETENALIHAAKRTLVELWQLALQNLTDQHVNVLLEPLEILL